MKLRKVKFKMWIPHKYILTESGDKKLEEGTGCWQKDFENEGFFHQWATSHIEFENGIGNDTIAIVERFDGTILQVSPRNLKFVTLPNC
jgi:hypothetical protein